MLFQDILKELRKKKGISQYQLANEINVSRSVIAKWETGLALPNEENLNILSEYFGLTKEELLGDFEHQQLITSKNKKISLFQKIIYILGSLLLLTTITITVLASIGFKRKETNIPPVTSEKVYTLQTNEGNIYSFGLTIIKPSNEYEQEKEGYLLIGIPLNRGQYVTLFKNDENFNDAEITWNCAYGTKGTYDAVGNYHLWQEGLYNITLFEHYYEEILIDVEIILEKVDTIYQSMKIYFADNSKAPIEMQQITPEYNYCWWCWYVNNCLLEEGDKIIFSARIKETNEAYILDGFKDSDLFEEIYDEELDCYYLLVKETHLFSEIVLVNSGSKISIDWEYNNQ